MKKTCRFSPRLVTIDLLVVVFLVSAIVAEAQTDPNDRIATAETLTTPTPSTPTVMDWGTISPGTDVDMFRISVTAGQKLSFDVDRRNGSSLDSYLRLFNANGSELAHSDDDPAPGEPRSPESYLEYSFTTAASIYVGVSGYANSSYNPTTGAGDVSGSTAGGWLI